MAVNKEAPWKSIPGLAQKQLNTTTWGAGGNTTTITDTNIHINSMVLIQVTGTVPQAGQWAFTYSQGSLLITSSDAESSTLAITYIVL